MCVASGCEILIPAISDPSGDGEIFGIGVGYAEDAAGTIRMIGLRNIIRENRESSNRCVLVAQHLAGRSLRQTPEIHFLQARQNSTGNSWDLPLTLALTSLLSEIPLKKNVTGTGRITETGVLCEVSSYQEKFSAAKNAEMKTFLVPP